MNTYSGTRNSGRKKQLRSLLEDHNFEGVLDWAADEPTALRTMHSLLWDSELLIVWRDIEAIGLLSREVLQTDADTIREFIRKLFWSMNDESGNLCWFAAEAIGEILYNCPPMQKEYLDNLLAFLDEEPFESGVRFSIMRLAGQEDLSPASHTALTGTATRIVRSLHHIVPRVRGYSILALQALGQQIPDADRKLLLRDIDSVPVYNYTTGRVEYPAIGELLNSEH